MDSYFVFFILLRGMIYVQSASLLGVLPNWHCLKLWPVTLPHVCPWAWTRGRRVYEDVEGSKQARALWGPPHEWTHSMTAYSKYPNSQNIHKGWQLFDGQARNPQWTRGKVPTLSVVSMCEILTQRCRQQSPKPKRWKPWHFIGEALRQCVCAELWCAWFIVRQP